MTTTYTLRSASPAKTRADAVVVGVLSTDKGPVLCDEAAEVGEAWGRKLRPLLSSLGVTGTRRGERQGADRRASSRPRCSCWWASVRPAKDGSVTPTAVRRAAGVAARSVPNAASVALALPAGSPELVAAATEGHLLGGYTFTRHKSGDAEDTAPGEVVVLSPVARKAEAVTAFEEAQVVARAVITCRDWVNEPPGHLTPPAFADAVTEAHRELTKGRGAPKVTLEVLDEQQLAELGCGGTLAVGNSSDAKPRMVRLTCVPQGRRGATSRSSARASPSTPAVSPSSPPAAWSG